MNLSPNTINLCLELLDTVSVPVTVPDAEAKMAALVAARSELIAALDAGAIKGFPKPQVTPTGLGRAV